MSVIDKMPSQRDPNVWSKKTRHVGNFFTKPKNGGSTKGLKGDFFESKFDLKPNLYLGF